MCTYFCSQPGRNYSIDDRGLLPPKPFHPDHVKTPEIDSILNSVTHVYIEGPFLTHGFGSASREESE